MSHVRFWRMWMMAVLLVAPLELSAVVRQARLPLHDGKLHTDDLAELMTRQLGLRSVDCPVDGTMDLYSLRGNLFVRAMNASFGDGCRLTVEPDQLVLHIDTDKLPRNLAQGKRVARVFTSVAAPKATADQNRMYGLLLPQRVDPRRPLVVLVHGLDCAKSQWHTMARLLTESGHQVAYFTFPSDQPLIESVELMDEQMEALGQTFPNLRIDVLTYSMGGLVARGYVEGPGYGDEISRLIMVAPPNHGSSWARYRWALEVEEHYHLWKSHRDWRWTWPITDGLGEAGSDLKPDSVFLDELNSLPRRQGVRYTIIAGNRHPAKRITANLIEAPLKWTPKSTDDWWGLRHTRSTLKRWGARVRTRPGTSDGPVKLKSAALAGVDDFVILPSDHALLCQPEKRNHPPIAWKVIQERLAE